MEYIAQMIEMGEIGREAAPNTTNRADTTLSCIIARLDLVGGGEAVGENAIAALEAISGAARSGLSGASHDVVICAVVRLSNAVRPISNLLGYPETAPDIEFGLRSAAGVVRSFEDPTDGVAAPDPDEFGIWVDAVAVAICEIRITLCAERIQERVRRRGWGGAPTATTVH